MDSSFLQLKLEGSGELMCIFFNSKETKRERKKGKKKKDKDFFKEIRPFNFNLNAFYVNQLLSLDE